MPAGVHEPNKPDNYFAWRPEHPVHLSVGAVVVNDDGKIMTVYLSRVDAPYFLPTKSHKPGATLEQTLATISARVGYELVIDDYLGVTVGQFPTEQGVDVTKSVIWFRCSVQGVVDRDPDDRDADSEIQWKSKDELVQIFAAQSHISSDVDQRKVLELL